MSNPSRPDPADPLAGMQAALARGDMALASAEARRAADEGRPTALALILLALERQAAGRPAEALPILDSALSLAPEDARVHEAYGRVFTQLGRPDGALAAFDAALSLAPNYPAAHAGRGLALESLGQPEAALASLEIARRLDPANAEAIGAAAALLVAMRRDGARELAGQALALDPWQPAANLATATLDQRDGDLPAARRRLEHLLQRAGLAPLQEANARRALADILDVEGAATQALAEYKAANGRLRDVYAGRFERPGAEDGAALCRRLQADFAKRVGWAAAASPSVGPAAAHIFLVGFPRSGTTLLEQVLASHPEVVALEERPTLGDVGAWFANAAAVERLSTLDKTRADALRDDYWRRVRTFDIEPGGRVFVDKQPLNTLWLPYVAKLFPTARVLFARRDPRDVVLSCFRRRFTMNGATFAFTDLAKLAGFYAEAMALAEVYRHVLAVPWLVHRHESLVADFDREAGAVCAFLDLPWTDRLRDFADTARRRDVRTPSAQQVRRGLYREGVGQWRRYADGMGDALAILQPWVERFGYAPE